jgi:hypothetical protein
MKIIESIRRDGSSASAIIEVDAGEVADIDEMLRLLEGENGSFGFDVKLVSTKERPEMKAVGDRKLATRQMGFDGATEIKKHKRYYQIHVNLD